MKKKLFLFILLLILFPNIVLAGGSEDDTVADPNKWESDVMCIYEIDNSDQIYDPIYDVYRTQQESLVLKYHPDYVGSGNIVNIYGLALQDQNTLIYRAANEISFAYGFGYDLSKFYQNREIDADWDTNKLPEMIKNNEFCPSHIYRYSSASGYNTEYYVCHGEEFLLEEGNVYVEKDTCAETVSYLEENSKEGYTYTKYSLQNEYNYSTVHYNGGGYQFLYDLNDQINADMKQITGTTLNDYHKKNVLKFVRDVLLSNMGGNYIGADSWDQYAAVRNKEEEVSNKITTAEDSLFECTYAGNESKSIKPVKLSKTTSGFWVAYLYDGDELKPSANSDKWIRAENYVNYTGSKVFFKNVYLTLNSTTQRCPHYVDYYEDFLSIEGVRYDFTFTPSDTKLDENYGNFMGIYSNEPEEEVESSEGSGMTQCESLLGNPDEKGTPAYYLVFIFDVMKYVAIVILIVFTVMELVTAISSHDSDIINKTLQKAFKRLIICVVIFVLPTLISFLLSIMDNIPNDLCGIK